jgi:hypothetical protein
MEVQFRDLGDDWIAVVSGVFLVYFSNYVLVGLS